MFDGLGAWLQANSKDKWPHFLLFVGDQIYADEIGDHHATMMTFGRFAERIPGPADPAVSARDKLIDGAWAGRFAHRYQPYKHPGDTFVKNVANGLQKLNDIHARYPDIKGIYREYPDADPREKLKERYRTLKNRRETTGAKGEASDERKAREAVELLPVVDKLEISAEPFRAFVRHWNAGSGLAYRGNPMGLRYLAHNFLLWSLPDFERQLPTVSDRGGFTVARKPDGHGHPSADRGRACRRFRGVRVPLRALLDQLPQRACAARARPHVPDVRRSRADRRLELRRLVGADATQPERLLGDVAQNPDRRTGRILGVPGLVQQNSVAMEQPGPAGEGPGRRAAPGHRRAAGVAPSSARRVLSRRRPTIRMR